MFRRQLLHQHALTPARLVVPAVPPEVEAAIPEGWDKFRITAELGRLLASLVIAFRRTRLLEFGAGASSRVHASALEYLGGGMLTAIEQAPAWCAKVWREVEAKGIDARLVPSPVRFMSGKWGIGYAHPVDPEVIARAPYDLVLVDGPLFRQGRLGTLPAVARLLAPGCLIVVDDADRMRRPLASWLRLYPRMRVNVFDPAYGGRGVAMLEWRGGRPKLSPRAFLGGIYHAASAWKQRRG